MGTLTAKLLVLLMKVLHVIPSLSPALGGPTQVALKVVKAIREQGIDAEIVTTNHEQNHADIPLNKRVEYEDVPVWFLPAFPLPLKEYIFSAALTKWLWRNIGRYDILDNHYLFSYVPSCAGAIARWCKTPYTVRTQGQLTPWALDQSTLKKQVYTTLIERKNLNKAAAIHCTTQQEAQDLRDFGIDTPTITLPLGVEKSTKISTAKLELHQKYNIAEDKLIILFLSRLHYKKRPDLLIESLGEVINHNQNFHLVMAGNSEPEYLSYLQQLVAQYDLDNYASFPGFVTGRDKDLLLQGADIFALPSHSENFGIAVAEAMAAGLPVIITPGVQIAVEVAAANAGIIVENETELADAILQLLNSSSRRLHLSHNAIALAQGKYAWTQIANQLITAYAEILTQP